VFDFFEQILQWLDSDIYVFFRDAYSYYLLQVTEARLKSQLFIIDASWEAAKALLSSLNISGELNVLMGRLEPSTVKLMNFFNIPSGINLLINALITRLVMRFAA